MAYTHSTLLQKTIFLSSVITLAFLIGFYMVQVQSITHHSYQVKSYQTEVGELRQFVQGLDNRYQHLTTLEALSPKIEVLGLVPVENLAYLDLSTQRMAAK